MLKTYHVKKHGAIGKFRSNFVGTCFNNTPKVNKKKLVFLEKKVVIL